MSNKLAMKWNFQGRRLAMSSRRPQWKRGGRAAPNYWRKYRGLHLCRARTKAFRFADTF